MRTETKQINIYKFDELSKEIQEKLIEKEIECQNEIYCEDFLHNDMQEEAKRLLHKYFKNNNVELNKIYYDLSYCQGSGAMFEFTLYYYNKFVKIKQYGYYYHERSFIIDTWELTTSQETQLKNKIIKMFEEFTKKGFDLIEYRITKNEAIEILQENEYLENGDIY